MSPEIVRLYDEFSQGDNHDSIRLRGCIADIVKNKTDRNLLNQCLNAGVLQDFFKETTRDTFFINRCKTRLIEEFFINETAAEKALSFCKFLTEKEQEIELIPYRKGNKWGFCDKNKRIVIENKYNFVDQFNEGLACVNRSGKYGFIDKIGKEIVTCEYDYANSFEGGLATVRHNDKFGFINNKGREIIDCIYDNTYSFHEGYAGVKQSNKWGLIDKPVRRWLPANMTISAFPLEKNCSR